jgi:hypothetical protein
MTVRILSAWEDPIPICRGDAEVTGVPYVMMFGVMTLGPMYVRGAGDGRVPAECPDIASPA